MWNHRRVANSLGFKMKFNGLTTDRPKNKNGLSNHRPTFIAHS